MVLFERELYLQDQFACVLKHQLHQKSHRRRNLCKPMMEMDLSYPIHTLNQPIFAIDYPENYYLSLPDSDPYIEC